MREGFVELLLTCGSWQEAQTITDTLLVKHLVACVEMMEVKSEYHWQGKVEAANEIKLIMQSIADNFEKVEAEVGKLHSYETFVLQQIPLTRISEAAARWLATETSAE